jgi:hypothetical protein
MLSTLAASDPDFNSISSLGPVKIGLALGFFKASSTYFFKAFSNLSLPFFPLPMLEGFFETYLFKQN